MGVLRSKPLGALGAFGQNTQSTHIDLPPGFAHFLSRRSKQSVESLEAEFDALKESGKAVEALLERPYNDVRIAPSAPTVAAAPANVIPAVHRLAVHTADGVAWHQSGKLRDRIGID